MKQIILKETTSYSTFFFLYIYKPPVSKVHRTLTNLSLIGSAHYKDKTLSVLIFLSTIFKSNILLKKISFESLELTKHWYPIVLFNFKYMCLKCHESYVCPLKYS